jgi:hypothetical protein
VAGKYGVYPIPSPEESPKYKFSDFMLTLGEPKKHKPYRRAQMRYWSWRIAKGMGLKKPVNLHIIDHDQWHIFSDIMDKEGYKVSVPSTTLGQYHGAVTGYKRIHCVIVRLRHTPRENLYVLAHELCHAQQCEMDYGNDTQKFLDEYQVQQMLRGYLDNRFEVEARKTGIEWVERILRTEPLELRNQTGSMLIDKGTKKKAYDESKRIFGYERENEGSDFYFTWNWKSSSVVGQDKLSKVVSDKQAKRIVTNLRFSSLDRPHEVSNET